MIAKNRRVRSVVIPLCILFFIVVHMVQAGTTGKIAGIITTTEGEGLPGANVIIKAHIVNGAEHPLNPVLGASTDINGEYFIINIRPGNYVIECSMIGFQTQVVKNVNITVDLTSKLNFTLSEQIMEGEAVIVTAEREMVIKDLTSTSARVSGSTIEELPVESFSEVLSLQAGITEGINGGIHIRGGRSSEIKYYVDGIAISNPFNNGLAVPVENNSIQELEVISGTFNAEYGQAQSGIVNIVTKEGSQEFSGSVSAYTGDFLSSNTNVFANIDDVDPFSQKYMEANISGPLFKNLTFFASTKITEHENWLYGKNIFAPTDSSNFNSKNPDDWFIESTGDSSYVSMNPSKGITGQLKLSYQLSPTAKIAYNIIYNYTENKNWNGASRYNPESQRTNYSNSQNHLLDFNHTLTPSSFYNIKLAYYETDYESYVHKDWQNPEYAAIYRPYASEPSNVFSTGGIDSRQSFTTSKTYAIRGDYNHQIDKWNLFKLGVEYRQYELDSDEYSIEVNLLQDRWLIPQLSSAAHNAYNKKPYEFAAYIQDKIEISDFIVNVGLRFDYFEPEGEVPTDFQDPNDNLFPEDNPESAYKSVDAKTQVSPRLGLAFPISETGVIHAAYGQFFQIPEFNRLYENPDFEVTGAYSTFIGNADLDAQRTDMYEIGLQQQLASFIAVDVTGYYRNVRELLGSELYQTYREDIIYGRYANNSYGNVLGFILAAKIRVPSYGITADLNYTYQSAKGVASDPKQQFADAGSRNESLLVLNPLDWDLKHTFNAFLNYSKDAWSGSIVLKMNSGYPFTPANYNELRNAGRYKGDIAVDLYVSKRYKFKNVNLEVFGKVLNLLDQERIDLLPEISPIDLLSHTSSGANRINSIYDYRLNPALQPKPREIRLGIKVGI